MDEAIKVKHLKKYYKDVKAMGQANQRLSICFVPCWNPRTAKRG